MSIVLERDTIRSFQPRAPMSRNETPADLPTAVEFTSGDEMPSPTLGTVPEVVDFELDAIVRRGEQLARLRVAAKQRFRDGPATLVLAEAAGGLAEVWITIDLKKPRPYKLNLRTRSVEGSDPALAWEMLHFLSLCAAPAEFSVGLPGRAPVWNPIPLDEPPVSPSSAKLALQLRTIARHAGLSLRMPDRVTPDQQRRMCEASTVAAGGTYSGEWIRTEIVLPSHKAEALAPGDLFRIEMHLPLEFEVGGSSIHIDRWARLYRARVSKRRQTDDGIVLALEPEGDSRVDYQGWPWPDERDGEQSPADIRPGDWIALVGDVVVASAAGLAELSALVSRLGIRPDAVLRAGSSDTPGMP